MPKVNVNGVNIYYESRGDGFPLVFAYGLAATPLNGNPRLPPYRSTTASSRGTPGGTAGPTLHRTPAAIPRKISPKT